jgi:hypothetical protein
LPEGSGLAQAFAVSDVLSPDNGKRAEILLRVLEYPYSGGI